MKKAFLFDVDGVLTDSADISKRLVARYFSLKGFNVDEESVVPYLGRGMESLFLSFSSDFDLPVDLKDALSFFRSQYGSEIASRPQMPGAMRFVLEAREKGMMTAVVSSAPLWRVEENLRSMGLSASSFSTVVTAESVMRNKPYPDIWQKAMENLGLNSRECIAFEDSFSGIRSALAAGIFTVALTGTIGEERAKEAGADALLDTFEEFPPFSSPFETEDIIYGLRRNSRKMVKYGANWIEKGGYAAEEKEREAKEAALRTLEHAYAPYSHFRVGAAVVSAATGKVYSGCNMENASYGATICAERNAITTAVAEEGAIGLDFVVVASEADHPAEPCAVCLQVISEFARPETKVILVNTKGTEVRYDFSDLLPHPFDFGERP